MQGHPGVPSTRPGALTVLLVAALIGIAGGQPRDAGASGGSPVGRSSAWAGLAAPAPQEPSSAPAATEPVLLLTARRADNAWEYSLTIAVPPDRALGELHVALALPPGSELVDALEAWPEVQFVGVEAGQAIWTASAPANSFVGPFSASVQGAADAATEARVTWAGPPAGESRVAVSREDRAGGREATLALTPEGSLDLLVLGDTGIRAAVPPGTVNSPSAWTARLAGPEANPPDGVAPGTWWCAAVELSGPDSLLAPIVLLLPTRQPLTPGVEITIFKRAGGAQWQETTERGVATPDGLFVAVPIREPGVYAAGSAARFRQVSLGGQASFQSLPAAPAASGAPLAAGSGGGLSAAVGSGAQNPAGGTGAQNGAGGSSAQTSTVGAVAPNLLVGGDVAQVGGATRALPSDSSAGTSVSSGLAVPAGLAALRDGPARSASQNCGGFGLCAFGGSAQFSAACSPDASHCVSSGSGPPPFTMVCSSSGGSPLRFCSSL